MSTPLDLYRLGFELGLDHARHGLAPPSKFRIVGHPVCEGWASGLSTHATKPLRRLNGPGPSLAMRHWLRLRLNAWCHGEGVDLRTFTPDLLEKIVPRNHPEAASYCPITRCALRGIDHHLQEKTPHDAKVVRINTALAWSEGNVMLVGRNAADALAKLPTAPTQRLQHALTLLQQLRQQPKGSSSVSQSTGQAMIDGLHAGQWARMGVMLSLSTPLKHQQAAALPLLVLPPHCLQPINPIQDVQALLTTLWLSPGWSRRRQQIEMLIDRPQPYRTLRRFLDLFVQRLMKSAHPDQPLMWRWAIEDTWRHTDVLQHWHQFALQIDATEAERIKNHANMVLDTATNHP
ncbi:hypothetical protein [Leptothrix ochracea]